MRARTPLTVVLALLAALYAGALFAGVEVALTQLGARSHSSTAELKDATDSLVGEIERATGLGYTGALSLVVCSDRDSFNNYSASLGGDHIGEALGFFAPPGRSSGAPVIALNLQLIEEVGAATRATGVYKHELMHAALWQNIPDYLRPLWLEEGVAQYVSETPIEAGLRASGWAGGTGRDPVSLDDVSVMLRSPEEAGFGYPHAAAAVALFVQRFGEDGLKALLAELKYTGSLGNRDRFEEVFGRALNGASFATFQDSFVAKRERTTFWGALLWVGQNYWPLMMGFAAILLVLAIRRRRKKHGTMVEEWKERDALYAPDPEYASAAAPEEATDKFEDAMEAHSELHDDPIEEAMREHRELQADADDDDAEPPEGRRWRK